METRLYLMARKTPQPFAPHTWADNDPTLSPSAEKFNDMEEGIENAHIMPVGRAMTEGVVYTNHAQVVEVGVTAEYTYTPSDFTTLFDEFGMHPGRTSVGRGGRLYIPVAGVYLVTLFAQSTLGAADTGPRFIAITKNGVQLAQSRDRQVIPVDLGEQSVHHVGAFVAGDMVGFQIYQAASLNDVEWRVLHLQWALLSFN
jgi:hypothetical protein